MFAQFMTMQEKADLSKGHWNPESRKLGVAGLFFFFFFLLEIIKLFISEKYMVAANFLFRYQEHLLSSANRAKISLY